MWNVVSYSAAHGQKGSLFITQLCELKTHNPQEILQTLTVDTLAHSTVAIKTEYRIPLHFVGGFATVTRCLETGGRDCLRESFFRHVVDQRQTRLDVRLNNDDYINYGLARVTCVIWFLCQRLSPIRRRPSPTISTRERRKHAFHDELRAYISSSTPSTDSIATWKARSRYKARTCTLSRLMGPGSHALS